jgi:hypothetical protein
MKELSGLAQERTRPGRVRLPQAAASFLTRSGATTHRSEARHPPPVGFFVLARLWFRAHTVPVAARYRGIYR